MAEPDGTMKAAQEGEGTPRLPPEDGKAMRIYWVVLSVAAVLIAGYYLTGGKGAPPAPPSESVVLLDKSLRLYNEGRYEEAIAAAQGVLKLEPNSAPAFNNVAVSYQALGQYDKAAEAAKAALRIAPGFQLAKNNLAAIERDQQYAEVAKNPKTAADWLIRSLVFYKSQKYEECLQAAKQSAMLAPDSAEAYNNISACAAGLKRWHEAISAGRMAIRLKPDFQLAKNNVAAAVEKLDAETKQKGK